MTVRVQVECDVLARLMDPGLHAVGVAQRSRVARGGRPALRAPIDGARARWARASMGVHVVG